MRLDVETDFSCGEISLADFASDGTGAAGLAVYVRAADAAGSLNVSTI